MHCRRKADDFTAWSSPFHRRQKEVSEEEVANVVYSHLILKSLLRLSIWTGHDACIIYEKVNLPIVCIYSSREGSY